MWIVELALRRPYTFVVMAVLIAILGGTAIVSMPVDIFPYIDIPIVSVVWPYFGLSPEEMEKRVVTNFERNLTSGVNDIEHIESQSYKDIAVVRVYFQSNVQIDMAVAQVTAAMQSGLRAMPPGMFPANVLKYDAGSVPILKLGLSSKTLREQEIFDLGQNFIRTPLATVQGAAVSFPFGGKNRSVMVDLNLDQLYAKQLSPLDVSNALNLQNLILPAGTAKMAQTEYQIRVNSSPVVLDDLNNLPIKTVNGATVFMKDVAQVRDGFAVQSNIVRENGARGVMLSITRTGKASTLSVVNAVKAALPRILAMVPPELNVVALADQSVFVRASIQGVVREALIAAGLTGMLILLFLGSWRSTLIVCISIPLSILASLCILSVLGQTINVMTLGGLALAVGILVDLDTVRRLAGAGIAEPEIEASLLIGHLVGCSRTGIFLRADEPLSLEQLALFGRLLSRRLAREPLAYILGEQEFWSLPFTVSREVLVPRPETEELLEKVFAVAGEEGLPDGPALDLGVGSGAISVVLALELEGRKVVGVDRSLAALRVAASNLRRHGVADRALLLNSDWLSAIRPARSFSLVVSNPPYVSETAMDALEPEVRDYEPRLALVGGPDGLREIRRLVAQVHRVLQPGGLFFMEIGADQQDAVLEMVGSFREYDRVRVDPDPAGRPRILQARRR